MSDNTEVPRKKWDGVPAEGLVCRACGCSHFYTVSTRAGVKNTIVRRRECRHCGRRVSTVETTK
jgi:hypothetical protein